MSPHKPPSATDIAGLYKISRKDVAALEKAAAELGHACFNVNLSRARNVPGFIKALKRDLEFPAWFGGNLDALNDCLTDFSWHPAPGYVIVLNHSEVLRATPTSFAALSEVLASAVEEWKTRKVPFKVFFVLDDSASGLLPK